MLTLNTFVLGYVSVRGCAHECRCLQRPEESGVLELRPRQCIVGRCGLGIKEPAAGLSLCFKVPGQLVDCLKSVNLAEGMCGVREM